MVYISRLFVNSMVSVEEVGLYTIAYQITSIIAFFTASFNRAWSPFLFEKLKDGNYKVKLKIVKYTYIYFLAIICLILFLSLLSPFVLRIIVGPKFYYSYKYIFWLALAFAFDGMYYMVVNYIFYIKKVYLLSCISLISALIGIGLNYLLIKNNGAVGAAQATAYTFLINFLMVWALSAKVYPMPWFMFNRRRLVCTV